MTKPLSEQFVQLYRGYGGVSPETMDMKQLGRHWTSNRWIARSFASDTVGADEPSTVIGALVHRRHIIPEGTPEWDEEAGIYGSHGSEGVESEYTVRQGAPVHLTSITHYPNAHDDEEFTGRSSMPLHKLRRNRA